MKYFFISTSHLESRIWFPDDNDFRIGMNYVAVVALATDVTVIAFILMSNHVHFLVLCESEADARHFISDYKKRYGMYFRNKYGKARFLRRNDVDIQEITLRFEAIERVIAYIVVNSVAARVCAAANGYKWGSGSCYFNLNKESGRPLSSMSGRERIAIFKSNAKLPGQWKVGADGFILPESYIPVKLVESIFRTPTRYNYFLQNSSKAKRIKDAEGPAFRDQVILGCFKDLCQTLCNKNGTKDLNDEEQKEIVKQLRWRLGADGRQISRVTGIDLPRVSEMLLSV